MNKGIKRKLLRLIKHRESMDICVLVTNDINDETHIIRSPKPLKGAMGFPQFQGEGLSPN